MTFKKGYIPSKEHKESLRKNHADVKGSKNPFYGKLHSEESKMKNRLSHIGKNLGKDNPFFGKRHTKETKQNMSETRKYKMKLGIIKPLNYWLGKKNLERSKKMKGKKMSENTKKKMSLSQIGEKNSFYGKHHSKESIRKYKKWRKTFITPKKDTSIEVKIQNFLKQLGIEFFTHQYIKIEHGYQCDILIPSMNLVIECDGNYWHKYPIGNEIDHIRTKELIQKGFKVLRLWENEIKVMEVKDLKKELLR